MVHVEIEFAEINGLYSYGSEKNRIDFGRKTVIVGANNSGKSVIFKALNYFLKCLTETNSTGTKPWDLQNTHKITVGLVLNDTERRYMAEMLAIGAESGRSVWLAPEHVIEWLAPRLERVELTIRLEDNPYRPDYKQIEYAADLKDLDVTVRSQGWGSKEVEMHKSGRRPSRSESNKGLFYKVIDGLLEKYPTSKTNTKKIYGNIGQRRARYAHSRNTGVF